MDGQAPLGPLGRRRRVASRFRQVAEVLGRHGFGLLLDELGLEPLRPRLFHRQPARGHEPRGTRIRRALEELGPTFVKLGQALSTRPDLIPPDVLGELERLQDRVPPVSYEVLEPVLVEALGGRPVSQAFRSVDPEPLASASIAQVHPAVLHDGSQVVLKIQRPGIHEVIATDLEILSGLAHLAAGRIALPFDPVEVVEAFAGTLRRELDYRLEAANIERFRANFARWTWVRFPRVHPEYSNARVLVLERLRGLRITDTEALDRAGIDRRLLARRGARLFMKMVLEDGFFHGDPHPGNLYVEPGNRLALMDFGIVGRVEPETSERVAALLQALVERDPAAAVGALDDLGALDPDTDETALRRDLADVIDRHHGRTLEETAVGEMIQEILGLTYRHRIHLPRELFLLARVLVSVEGLGRQLDPGFNVVEVARPFVRRLLLQRYQPARVGRRLERDLVRSLRLWARIPEEVAGLVTRTRRGRLRVQVDHQGLEAHVRRIERALRELGVSLVFSAALLAAVLTLWLDRGPRLGGLPLATWLLLGFAGFLGAALFLSLFRR